MKFLRRWWRRRQTESELKAEADRRVEIIRHELTQLRALMEYRRRA